MIRSVGAVALIMGLVIARAPGSRRQSTWYRAAIPIIGLSGIAASTLLN